MEEHGGKVRFGVVGTNFITDWVIAGARQDDRFELVAVYSRKQETADAFAAKHQFPIYQQILRRSFLWKRWQKAR